MPSGQLPSARGAAGTTEQEEAYAQPSAEVSGSPTRNRPTQSSAVGLPTPLQVARICPPAVSLAELAAICAVGGADSSCTKTSLTPLVSPGTRLLAADRNVT